MGSITDNILIAILFYSFVICYLWRKLGKVYKKYLWIISYNCMWIYNYLETFQKKKKIRVAKGRKERVAREGRTRVRVAEAAAVERETVKIHGRENFLWIRRNSAGVHMSVCVSMWGKLRVPSRQCLFPTFISLSLTLSLSIWFIKKKQPSALQTIF